MSKNGHQLEFTRTRRTASIPRKKMPIHGMLSILGAMALLISSSYAGGILPTVSIGGEYHGYLAPQDACQAQLELGLRNPNGYGTSLVFQGLRVRSWLGGSNWIDSAAAADTPNLAGWMCQAIERYTPTGDLWYYDWIWMYAECPGTTPGTYQSGFVSICPSRPIYYVAGLSQKLPAEQGSSCNSDALATSKSETPKQSCGDPINPANGNTFNHIQDLTASTSTLPFQRYYNSSDNNEGPMGTNWRGAYSRTITANQHIASYQPTSLAGSAVSSLYNDEATACTSGFVQIQSQVPRWSGAIASFSDGVCNLTKSGISIGALPIYSGNNYNLAPESSPPSFDYTTDDGEVTRFSVINGVITAPPGTGLRLTQSTTGFTITDGNDNVERYDANGGLLSITSRGGVVQSMSYDASGRLSSVNDNFGHHLMLSYDAQGHLSGVTRQ